MFIAQAHSFTQQARLAITLAWVAGYTNIVTLIACGHVTSHVSGTTSDLGRGTIEGNWSLTLYALFLLGTFLLGAAISGVTTELGRRRGWESIYVLPMALEAALLGGFATILASRTATLDPADPVLHWLTGLASTAMGLQNATITRISAGVVRTTHVTGVLTDLGLEGVQFLWWIADRRKNVPPESPRSFLHGFRVHPTARRLALLLSILGSFAFGTALGTLAIEGVPQWAMLPPVAFLVWIIVQDIRVPIAEIQSSELVSGEHSLLLPDAIAIFHLRRQGARGSQLHRMPDLSAWADRLSPSVRVAILDLGNAVALDANAAVDLRTLLDRFARDGRDLILAGVTGDQLERLRHDGLGNALPADHVCTDLELAVAFGMNMLLDRHGHDDPFLSSSASLRRT
ncbi:MAG: DUF1275 family protein [Phycisphaerae bacterium]|nr:DUF1275 family protein [Phycisphaerae bacterium]